MRGRHAFALVGSGVVLALYGLLLPLRVADSDPQAVTVECMTLSDAVPTRTAARNIALYERCIALDPANAELLVDAGDLYASVGDGQRAEASYLRALEIDPRFAEAHVKRGRLLLRRGNAAGARAESEAALALTLSNAEALALWREASGGGEAAAGQ